MLIYKGFIAQYLGFGYWRIRIASGGMNLIGNYGTIAVLISTIDKVIEKVKE